MFRGAKNQTLILGTTHIGKYIMYMCSFWGLRSESELGFFLGMSHCGFGFRAVLGGFPRLKVPLAGPHNKNYNILWVYIGVPLFWETTT